MADKEKMADFEILLDDLLEETKLANDTYRACLWDLTRHKDEADQLKEKVVGLYQQALSQASKPKPHTPWRT